MSNAEFLGEATAFVLVTVPSDLARGVVARSVAALRKNGVEFLKVPEGYYDTIWETIGGKEMDATIDASSEGPGKGAAFRITFPLASKHARGAGAVVMPTQSN